MRYSGEGFRVIQTTAFVAWLEGLRDQVAQGRITARIRRLEFGHLGDWKPIDGAIAELRIDHGPGYRLYFARRGRSSGSARRRREQGARTSHGASFGQVVSDGRSCQVSCGGK